MGNILDIVLVIASDLVSDVLVHDGTPHVSHLQPDHSKITFSIPYSPSSSQTKASTPLLPGIFLN